MKESQKKTETFNLNVLIIFTHRGVVFAGKHSLKIFATRQAKRKIKQDRTGNKIEKKSQAKKGRNGIPFCYALSKLEQLRLLSLQGRIKPKKWRSLWNSIF